jgi:hypothetical protein
MDRRRFSIVRRERGITRSNAVWNGGEPVGDWDSIDDLAVGDVTLYKFSMSGATSYEIVRRDPNASGPQPVREEGRWEVDNEPPGAEWVVQEAIDYDADASYLEGERLAAHGRGDFGYMGLQVKLLLPRGCGCGATYEAAEASLWGIEDDAPEEHIALHVRELKRECLDTLGGA